MESGTAKCMIVLAVLTIAGNPAQSQVRAEEPKVISLDSLLNVRISTATRTSQTVSEAPASVTVITCDDIERYGYRTLDEILVTVKGFYRSYDRNYVYVGVRGFGRPADYNDRLLLLLDGHVMNDNFFGSAPLGTEFPLDFGAIERIEIVRGPGSALYGTGAMFAVINVITKRGAAITGLNVSLEAGSFGRLKGAVLAGKQWANGVEATISASWVDVKGKDLYYAEYDDAATNHGIAHDLDWDKYYSVFGSINYGGLSLTGFSSFRNKGIPTGAFDITFNDPGAHAIDRDAFLELKYNKDIGSDKSVELKTSYFSYIYHGDYPYVVNSFDETYSQVLEADAQFKWDFVPNNRLIAGIEWRHNAVSKYRYWDRTTVYFDSNFPHDVLSAYLQEEMQLFENLLITVGVRHDRDSFGQSSTTPRTAIVFNAFKSTTMKVLYGEGFRAPNPYETNYFDPISGFKTNPGLRAEKIRTLEAVWEQRIGLQSFGSCSLYRYWMTNLIDIDTDPADSLDLYRNISDVSAFGLELSLETRWKSGARGYVNYTFQNATDPSKQQQITNAPKHLAHLGLAFPVFLFLNAAFELQFETGRRTVYDTMTDPFLVANSHFVVPEILKKLTGSLSIRNLFNTPYSNPGGFEHKQPSILQDGRNILVALSYSF